jgi:ribosomal protein L11 methyltransferase
LGDYPALDLQWRSGPGAAEIFELLQALLDDFEPQAFHEHESADRWRVFFKTPRQRDAATAAVRTFLGGRLLAVSAVDVPDEEWARRSQADLTAIRIGRIVVAPPWHDPAGFQRLPAYHLQPEPLSIGHSADHLIVIDPSTGFGTGHHETTRLCLSLLQSIELAGRRVIDVGTGSGVLAIAAAKLGAASVVALDEDPEALRNARENVARNDVAALIDVREADLATYQGNAASVVVANLTGAVIQKHAGRLARLVEPGGALIVSGFNTADSNDVRRAFAHTVERELTEGEWAALLVRVDSPAEPTLGFTAKKPLTAEDAEDAEKQS